MSKITIRGRVYGLFPVDILPPDGDAKFVDCWFNKHFVWLFEFFNYVNAWVSRMSGVTPLFWITVTKHEMQKYEQRKSDEVAEGKVDGKGL